jgi:hypothetical protein
MRRDLALTDLGTGDLDQQLLVILVQHRQEAGAKTLKDDYMNFEVVNQSNDTLALLTQVAEEFVVSLAILVASYSCLVFASSAGVLEEVVDYCICAKLRSAKRRGWRRMVVLVESDRLD